MIDPNLPKDPHNEIREKVNFWNTRLMAQLQRFNDHANFWRLLKPPKPSDLSGFANPQVTETTRATEAIATFLYRALTSASPNFQFLSSNLMVPQESLWVSERVVESQLVWTNYHRKLMKACRSVSLFGTVIAEEPWTKAPNGLEATDFMPRSLLQSAFDPLSMDIGLSSWNAMIDFVTEGQLRYMAKMMPGVWDAQEIENAITLAGDKKNIPPEVVRRLSDAGYTTYGGASSGQYNSNLYQLTLYYGPLKDDSSYLEWCVATLNDIATIRGHLSSYKRRPFVVGHLNEFEMEPFSYGVGRFAESTQPEMNQNRGRMHDTVTFSLFNQWLVNRMANIKTKQLVVKPWGVIEVDGDPDAMLKALRPQLEGINFGLQLENMMKTEFRSTTGASDNLQAIVTDASATEASIAQTEAVRRLSVIAEIFSEPMLREHIGKMHENNLTFIDQPFSIGVTGEEYPVRVFPNSLASEVEVQTKVVTDKDFRPQRNKDLLQFLQVVTSIRNQNPQMGQVDLQPFVEEFARGVGMNPKRVWQAVPQVPMLASGPGGAPPGGPAVPNAMDRVAQMESLAREVRSNAGELGQSARASAGRELAGAYA